MARTVSIPSGRGFWAGEVRTVLIDGEPWVSIPSGRGFWAGRIRPAPKTSISKVSIPSGRGFWAGMNDLRRIPRHPPSLNPLWSGLLGRRILGPSKARSSRMSQSPLVGASGPASVWNQTGSIIFTSQSPLVGASGPAKFACTHLDNPFAIVSIPSGRGFWAGQGWRFGKDPRGLSQSPLVGASGPANPETRKSLEEALIESGSSLNPLWSGLLGRHP